MLWRVAGLGTSGTQWAMVGEKGKQQFADFNAMMAKGGSMENLSAGWGSKPARPPARRVAVDKRGQGSALRVWASATAFAPARFLGRPLGK